MLDDHKFDMLGRHSGALTRNDQINVVLDRSSTFGIALNFPKQAIEQ